MIRRLMGIKISREITITINQFQKDLAFIKQQSKQNKHLNVYHYYHKNSWNQAWLRAGPAQIFITMRNYSSKNTFSAKKGGLNPCNLILAVSLVEHEKTSGRGSFGILSRHYRALQAKCQAAPLGASNHKTAIRWRFRAGEAQIRLHYSKR